MNDDDLMIVGKGAESKAARTTTLDPVKRIRVNLQKRSYDILVSNDWLPSLGQKIRMAGLFGEAMVFTSPRIGDLYFDRVESSLKLAGFGRVVRHNIPDGEKNKNYRQWEKCVNALAAHFPDEGTIPVVINLGGGVVGDIGGFAAATFNRGVPYVQVPTSLLGCVDCGVGGKVGINRGDVKNQIGAFYQPKLVFADLSLLKTLDLREIRSGTAEVIKYGVVCSKPLFEFLEKNIEKLLSLDPAVLLKVVTDSYLIKARVVERDERDNLGIRMVLNFGHTVGHAIEMAVKYRMTHGEAISVGMIAAARIGVELKTCNFDLYERIRDLIQRTGLPISARHYKPRFDKVMANMAKDKKFSGGKNCFILPTTIGKWTMRKGVDQELVAKAIQDCIKK